jgi:sugar phosphate isomerase/epimerase
MKMNRRNFIKQTTLAATAVSALNLIDTPVARAAEGVHWPIGCYNRPWVDVKAGWTFKTALDGIKAAGYPTVGLLTPFKDEPFVGADATPEYLAGLKDRIAASGLKCNMAAIHTNPKLSVADSIKNIRAQIDKSKFLNVEFLLTFGTNRPEDYDDYYHVMADAAPYAQDKGLKLVLKPHGGGSGAAEEIIRCINKVNQPNFHIWYDAGNIIYYTGKDPIEQLKPIVQYVTGFCAKDCAGQKGEIWLDFGKGKVDFPAVFKMLKQAGYNGPVMVECCAKGPTPEDVTAGARRNREMLEKYFAEI